jgi:uncharacterized protein YjiS (DUF1127 family)
MSMPIVAASSAALRRRIRSALMACVSLLRLAAAGFSKWCHRIRAYNELAGIDPSTLHAIGRDRAEIERILEGLPPRRRRG